MASEDWSTVVENSVIVDAIRSPMAKGKSSGELAGVHPVDLLSQVLTALIERSSLDPGTVDDVLVGCVGQNLEQAATPGRQAWLAAGYPVHVPSTTIERKCGSGQQAVEFANSSIIAGRYDIAIGAGIESMSRVPMGSAVMGADPFGPSVRARFPNLVPQGVAAELVATRWKLSRAQLDEYSSRSHELADHYSSAGHFKREIVPITVPGADGGAATVVESDSTIRPDTTAEKLGSLKPVFESEKYATAFPEIEQWMITAGNSSQLTDGAAGLLLMSESRAQALGLKPRARIIASSVCGDDPTLMLTGPIPATHKVLARSGLSINDIDAFEVNEAFAPVPLAWQLEFGVPLDKLNPVGGAIALGHPLGASGCRLMTSLLNYLEATGGRYGLQTMCEAGGMANATIIEVLN
ncbi:MAG TPA: thiolase family protein [Acidothermaceae bacterium]|jgi:acetyl-CoA acyltransferase|nr:thiolase family protein [Acidothermaceae bacterium]